MVSWVLNGHRCFCLYSQWERVGTPFHTFSSQTLFISEFYLDEQYECDNAFQNFECVPEPFFSRKRHCVVCIATVITLHVQIK